MSDLSLLIFALFFGVGKVAARNVPENRVLLPQGELQGLSATSRDGRSFHAFKGIPYGKVERRFAVPVPADTWTGILLAHDSGPGCVNSGLFTGVVTGKEQCLTLDVYTPRLPPSNTTSPTLYPVMVWIYGGDFVEGKSRGYGGSYFMDHNIVLVVLNYRIGVLGFLNAGVDSASGNQGLKDQVLGLQWIQDNIAHFSGQKEKVTIFGESAGAISVSLHTLSPMSKGLFHGAIMQSGPGILPFMYHGVDGPSLAKKVAREVDCPSSNMEYLVECLEKIDVKFLGPLMRVTDEIGWDESAIWMGPSYEIRQDNETEVFMSEPRGPLYSTAIKEHFMHGRDINSTTVFGFENLISERHWIHPFRVLASLYSKHVPVYAYNFTQHPFRKILIQCWHNICPNMQVNYTYL